MHHSAPFAAVRWTNIYDPHSLIFRGDIISGPVAPVFGDGIRDIDLKALRGQSSAFSHTRYWMLTGEGQVGGTPAHIKALRQAVNLLDRPHRSRPATPRHSPKHRTSPVRRAEGLWRNVGSSLRIGSGGGMEKTMSEVTLFGFPRSTYVQIAGLVLTHKDVPYRFHDLESEMGGPSHLALHPFDRVPILRHGDFTLYETAAITSYVDDAFDGPKLTPTNPQRRARMSQWISAINGYYYPYMIYHVSHER